MRKPNWHVIVMDNAWNIEIDGITQPKLADPNARFTPHRLLQHQGHSGNPNDANQDGMDCLGGGDTTVRNSFFRASDDVFALQGNWDGYDLRLGQKLISLSRGIAVRSTLVVSLRVRKSRRRGSMEPRLFGTEL